jgi:D-3-phosphoglycerate dehydrogenase
MPTRPLIVRTDSDVGILAKRSDELLSRYDIVTCPDDREETIAAAAATADLILTCYARITRHVIDSATRLRGIVKYGVGVDSIDLEAATRRGVYVANAPDYGTETVADHAFALLMALSRKLPTIATGMRQDCWSWPVPKLLAGDIYGKTLGLIGFGRIGKAVARRSAGFGMRVLAADPYVHPKEFERRGVEAASLENLLAQSDFVSLHCVLTPETQAIVAANELQQMKRSAYLINVSRGALVDQRALVAALDEGAISGAACDVFPNEPLTRSDPLAGRENVILTPHLAWFTAEAEARLDEVTLNAIHQILGGQVPTNLKNRELLQPAAAEAVCAYNAG